MRFRHAVALSDEQDIPTARSILRSARCAVTKRVLLVDDEETIREVGKEVLQALGYCVSVARDGEEALGLYEKQYARFDVVLLDMAMPGMDGGEVYDSLKRINPQVKVLLLSGYGVHGKARKVLEKGCNGFLQKPFGLSQLSQRIREICESPGVSEGDAR